MTTHSAPTNRRPSARRVLRGLVLVTFATATALALLFGLARSVGAQAQAPLAPGAPSAGNLTSRLGDAWQLYACAGDVVTVTAVSTAFAPYIELYAPAQELPQIEAGSDLSTTLIAGAPLAQTGVYTVAVLGERLSSRGPYSLTATFAGTPTSSATDAPDGYMAVGQSVTGTLASRFGDLWQVHLCAGAPVTITMRAADYTPVVEFAPAVSGTLVQVENLPIDEAAQWMSFVFTPALTMDALVAAGGAFRSDRGEYRLFVEAAGPPALAVQPIAPATPTRTPRSLLRPAATPSPTATPRPTATRIPIAAPACRVLVQALRLRSGPGTQYEPPLAGLALDTALDVLGRSADSGWLNVRVQAGGLSGWVSAGTQYVACNAPISSFTVVQTPPTPTSTNTPLPTPTPIVVVVPPATPTRETNVVPTPRPLAFVIPGMGGGGGGANVTANLRTASGVAQNQDGVALFTDQLWFLADIATEPGRTVKRVDFRITSADQEGFSYEHSEGTAAFCVFGGGEPDCNVLWLSQGAMWPGTDIPVLNDTYNVRIDITLENDDSTNRSTQIRIQSPNLRDVNTTLPAPEEATPEPELPPQAAEIQVELREVGPGSTELVVNGAIAFQVAAWDPTVGDNNGDGIDSVYFSLNDSSGTVHERTEGTAAFCAFGGGEPDCNVYDYAAAGYMWESGAEVQFGSLTLEAEIYADDGRVAFYSWSIEVQ